MDKSKNSRFNMSKNSRLLEDKKNESMSKFQNDTYSSLEMNKTVYKFTIILLGNISVGKTCILGRFTSNFYSSVYKCSISADFRIKELQIDKTSVADLTIWDTCGDEKYKSISKQYFRKSNGVILTFDITNHESFRSLGDWLSDLRQNAQPEVVIIVVGNKADLEANRTVSPNEINSYVKSQNFEYIEVSAKTGMNIQLLFETLANKMIKQHHSKNNTTSQTNNNMSNSKKSNRNGQSNHDSEINESKSLRDFKKKEVTDKNGCC